MTLFDREFNVLWIVIETTNDDQIFDAPGDKEFVTL